MQDMIKKKMNKWIQVGIGVGENDYNNKSYFQSNCTLRFSIIKNGLFSA